MKQLMKVLSNFFHPIYMWVAMNIFGEAEKIEEPLNQFFIYNIRNRGSGDEFILTSKDDHELVRKFAHQRGFAREPENIRVQEYMIFYYPEKAINDVIQCEIIVYGEGMVEIGRYDNRRDLERDFSKTDNVAYGFELIE